MRLKKIGQNMQDKITTYNIREERLKTSQEKKKSVDEVKENAKKHFEEIFNRV